MIGPQQFLKNLCSIFGLILLSAPALSFANKTATISVSAMVLSSCEVEKTSALAVAERNLETTAAAPVGVQCSNGTSYTLKLDRAEAASETAELINDDSVSKFSAVNSANKTVNNRFVSTGSTTLSADRHSYESDAGTNNAPAVTRVTITY